MVGQLVSPNFLALPYLTLSVIAYHLSYRYKILVILMASKNHGNI